MKVNSVLVCIVVLVMFAVACQPGTEEKLPYLGRKEINGQDTTYHTISDFKFVNQDSNVVTHENFKGQIYVSDFFFTTCPTICPIMKTQMLRVYEQFKDNDQVSILSHTIDPKHDTVGVLKEFASRLGVESSKWHFVTGEKEEIYKIGQTSYMVSAVEDPNEPGGFIHSGAFILIDKQRRVRGVYDGTKEDQVNKLMGDMLVLLKEYE
ncbi:SCO family protein [Fulvivirga sp. M361]|uniref:SCO family protein n=1 Tax=Fulvivirga sp. M361 TaxID=2594266 RepID=UPI001179FAAD|nr:SCO family protein [Fulvivirga sp. M361]TRX55544.1 SCO family protein [Fulvivirga sp. M361]